MPLGAWTQSLVLDENNPKYLLCVGLISSPENDLMLAYDLLNKYRQTSPISDCQILDHCLATIPYLGRLQTLNRAETLEIIHSVQGRGAKIMPYPAARPLYCGHSLFWSKINGEEGKKLSKIIQGVSRTRGATPLVCWARMLRASDLPQIIMLKLFAFFPADFWAEEPPLGTTVIQREMCRKQVNLE